MNNRIIGIILLVGGIILLYFGVSASDSPMDRVSEAFTGKFTDSTMLYLILGVIGMIAGLIMVTRRSYS
ncbi:MAG: hypothetical protein ACI82H_000745 [Alphaproteobacteria bacterium]|jgi:hypothetical protein